MSGPAPRDLILNIRNFTSDPVGFANVDLNIGSWDSGHEVDNGDGIPPAPEDSPYYSQLQPWLQPISGSSSENGNSGTYFVGDLYFDINVGTGATYTIRATILSQTKDVLSGLLDYEVSVDSVKGDNTSNYRVTTQQAGWTSGQGWCVVEIKDNAND